MTLAAVTRGGHLFPEINFVYGDHYLHEVPDADLLVTCTCLQHITDRDVFKQVIDSFHRKVQEGGQLVMFENAKEGRRSHHLHDMDVGGYIAALNGFEFLEPILVTDVDPEPHFLLRGVRKPWI